MMRVFRMEVKLNVFLFKIQFFVQVNELRVSLGVVNECLREVRDFVDLWWIMNIILILGNVLNQGIVCGLVVGFKLDSFLKLIDICVFKNSKMILMYYLSKVVVERVFDLVDFYRDLVYLDVVGKVQLKSLVEEMQVVSKGLEMVEQELIVLENDGLVLIQFWKVLKEFLDMVEVEVRFLVFLYVEVGRNVDVLLRYFGEDFVRYLFE